MPQRVPLAIAACCVLLTAGCGSDPAIGTWSKISDDDKTIVTFYDDGKVAISSGNGGCTGTSKREDDSYRLDLDCGSARGMFTARIEKDDTLTITDPTGKAIAGLHRQSGQG